KSRREKPAFAGMNGHHQNEIDKGQELIDRRNRSGRKDGETGTPTGVVNGFKRLVGVVACLEGYGQYVSARSEIRSNMAINIVNEKVDIERRHIADLLLQRPD